MMSEEEKFNELKERLDYLHNGKGEEVTSKEMMVLAKLQEKLEKLEKVVDNLK